MQDDDLKQDLIGYKNPPQRTQFKKGKSGNSRGRPKGAKNKAVLSAGIEKLKALLYQEAYRDVSIQESGRTITMPMMQAIIRSLTVSAAKGNLRAQRLILQTLKVAEDEDAQIHSDYVEGMSAYKHKWEAAIEEAKRLGLPIPDPVPHPKHIKFDRSTGNVRITGPFTDEEKENWDKLRQMKQSSIEKVNALKAKIATTRGIYKEILKEDLADEQYQLNVLLDIFKKLQQKGYDID